MSLLPHPVSRRAVVAGLLAASAVPCAGRSAHAVGPAGAGRIVSLGGAVTEILYALGCGDRIAAVDLTSVHPPATRAKPNVGYYRRLSAEGVLALSPDLVLAADGAGPKEAMDVLAAASVRLVTLREVRRADDVGLRIRIVADAVGESARGAELADAVMSDLAILAADVGRIRRRRRTLVLLGPSQGGALTAGGTDSTGAFALELCGADNAAAAMTGWKALVDEAAFGLEPEAVVVMATGAPVTIENVARTTALAASPAVRENRIVVADALGFVGFGPRVAHVARDVARAIYPEHDFRELPVRPWTAGAPTAR